MMKKRSRTWISVMWCCFALLIFDVAYAKLAHLPLSNRLVAGRVTLPGGTTVQFSILEGVLVVVFPGDGKAYGLRPAILDEEALRVEMTLFEMIGISRELEVLREIETFEVEGTRRIDTIWEVELGIELTGIRDSGLTMEEVEKMRTPIAPVLSDRVVSGRVTLPNGKTAMFSVLEGSKITLRYPGEGYQYTVVPTILDAETGLVDIVLVETLPNSPGPRGLVQLHILRGNRTEVEVEDGTLAVEITEIYDEIILAPGRTADRPWFQTKMQDCSDPASMCCCVQCQNNEEACGCKVQLSCGFCCVDPCCPPPPPGPPGPIKASPTGNWFIVLNLEGGPYKLTGLDSPVEFDGDGDGIRETLGWTRADFSGAFLALDRNGNGTIDNGNELFGDLTEQPETDEPNGFSALAVYDQTSHGGNADGRISEADAIYVSLKLWTDRDHDGISRSSELDTLPERGVRAIELDHTSAERRDPHGNLLCWSSMVELDGSKRLAATGVVFVTE